jgi:hypothetical protein
MPPKKREAYAPVRRCVILKPAAVVLKPARVVVKTEPVETAHSTSDATARHVSSPHHKVDVPPSQPEPDDSDEITRIVSKNYVYLPWCTILKVVTNRQPELLRSILTAREGDAALWHDALITLVMTTSKSPAMIRIASAHSRHFALNHLIDMIEMRTDLTEKTTDLLLRALIQ